MKNEQEELNRQKQQQNLQQKQLEQQLEQQQKLEQQQHQVAPRPPQPWDQLAITLRENSLIKSLQTENEG